VKLLVGVGPFCVGHFSLLSMTDGKVKGLLYYNIDWL